MPVANLAHGERSMIPGELLTDDGEHPLNPGRRTLTLVVQNTADRPIQVGLALPLCRDQRRAGL
jgi:urease beta subunit